MPTHIRNGIDVARLAALAPDDGGVLLPPASIEVRTEWAGGMQSTSSIIQRAPGDGETSFTVRCDESYDRCGDNAAPASLSLAAAAVAAGFIQGLVIEAAIRDMSLDTVSVKLELSELQRDADSAPPALDCRIVCLVDTPADVEQLNEIALSAVKTAPVVRLLRNPPTVVLSVSTEKRLLQAIEGNETRAG